MADKGSCPEIRELSSYRHLLSLTREELLEAYIKMDREHKQRIKDLEGAVDVLTLNEPQVTHPIP